MSPTIILFRLAPEVLYCSISGLGFVKSTLAVDPLPEVASELIIGSIFCARVMVLPLSVASNSLSNDTLLNPVKAPSNVGFDAFVEV